MSTTDTKAESTAEMKTPVKIKMSAEDRKFAKRLVRLGIADARGHWVYPKWKDVRTARRVGFYFKVALSVVLLVAIYYLLTTAALSMNHGITAGQFKLITYHASYTYDGIDKMALLWINCAIFPLALSIMLCSLADVYVYEDKMDGKRGPALRKCTRLVMVASSIFALFVLFLPVLTLLLLQILGEIDLTESGMLIFCIVAFITFVAGIVLIALINHTSNIKNRSYLAQQLILFVFLIVYIPLAAIVIFLIVLYFALLIGALAFCAIASASCSSHQ